MGLSPIWLLGGFMLAGKVPVSDGPLFAGSAAVAQDLEPLTPAMLTDGERLAGIEPSGPADAVESEGTEVASLASSEIDEAALPEGVPGDALAASVTDAGGGDGSILRAAAGPEERARAHKGWRTAPDGQPEPDESERLAAAGSLLVQQPRWENGAVAAVPIPRPKPEWLDDPAGLVTQREASAASEPDESRTAAVAGDARIVIHHGTPAAESAARRLSDIVDVRGLGSTELRRVDAGVSEANVRYFHPQDRAAAESVNQLLRQAGYGSELKDFTHYEPAPSRGTVEVWLPG